MFRNVAPQTWHWLALGVADGLPMTTLDPGADISIFITKDNGAQTPGTGGLVHKGKGQYEYRITDAAETDADHMAILVEAPGMIAVNANFYPIVRDDYKADVSALATQASVDNIPAKGELLRYTNDGTSTDTDAWDQVTITDGTP